MFSCDLLISALLQSAEDDNENDIGTLLHSAEGGNDSTNDDDNDAEDENEDEDGDENCCGCSGILDAAVPSRLRFF